MAQRRHHSQQPKRRNYAPATEVARAVRPEKLPPTKYGKPFVVLEDSKKNVFVVQGSQLVPHEVKIAEYRLDSQVKEMPQKIKGLTRYEICSPLAS